MNLPVSNRGEVARSAIERRGHIDQGAAIYRAPLPPPKWWRVISASAKRSEPYREAVKELLRSKWSDQDVPSWPAGFYELDDSFPPIDQSQALAIIERFLLLEHGQLVAGTQLHPLHWDVLTAQFAPLQERYQVLTQLVEATLLVQPAGGLLHSESALRWPLTVTQSCIDAIRRARLHSRLRFFHRVENALTDVNAAYPTTIRVLAWALFGGGVVKAIEWILAWLR